jgi:hypothetical protein
MKIVPRLFLHLHYCHVAHFFLFLLNVFLIFFFFKLFRCSPKFYRALSDNTSAPCTSPPSAPRNLTLASLDTATLTLGWEPPRDEGGRQDTVYR